MDTPKGCDVITEADERCGCRRFHALGSAATPYVMGAFERQKARDG